MSVAAIVLAAGASRRLGRPKQLVEIAGETLLERAVCTARGAGCEPVIVVLGAYAEEICSKARLRDVQVVLNQEWEEGMASSVRAGVAALRDSTDGCVVMTCDMPAVTAEHLRKLAASLRITASSYADRRGVPAYFPVAMFPDLLALRGDAGARELLRDAATLELAGGELDIDTAEDLHLLAKRVPQAR